MNEFLNSLLFVLNEMSPYIGKLIRMDFFGCDTHFLGHMRVEDNLSMTVPGRIRLLATALMMVTEFVIVGMTSRKNRYKHCRGNNI